MKKKLFSLTILILHFFYSHSQVINPNQYEKNLTKYWIYRERLKSEFMIGIGPSQGQSLPASERIRGRGAGGGALLKWGDCTIMLGQYIGVLALELRLLVESGSDYSKTAEELFFAMWAFNRLDLAGEPHWGQSPHPSHLNGFFIRDDVAGSLLATSQNHLNAGISVPNYLVSQFDSDFMAPEHKQAEMSIDQCYWMLCGLSLVDKYVPSNLFYAPPWGPNCTPIAVPFQDGVYGFVDEATKITLRMIKWMRQRNQFGWTWIVDNPHDNQPVGRGGDNALPLSHGLKQVYKNITGGDLVMKNTSMMVPDWIGYYISRGLWATSATHAEYVWQQEFKAIQIGTLANSWFEYMPFVDRNKINNKLITKRAHIINHHWIGLLHSALWLAPEDNFPIDNPNMRWACKPGKPYYDEFTSGNRYIWHPHFIKVRELLSLSHCEGLWKYKTFDSNGDVTGMEYGHGEWSSSSLTGHPEQKEKIDNGYCDAEYTQGDFNGIDFMLIHNLWYLYWSRMTPSMLPPFTDKINTTALLNVVPMPTSNPIFNYGVNQNETFEYLSKNKIYSNAIIPNAGANFKANIRFRAETEIELAPPFETQSGVFFEAVILPPECDETSGFILRETNLQSNSPSSQPELGKTNLSNIKIFPIPGSNEITIEILGRFDEQKIELFNSTGKMMNIYYIENNDDSKSIRLKVDISNLIPGIYLVKNGPNSCKFIKL